MLKEIIFWFSLGLMLFIYIGYPVSITLIAFFFKKEHFIDDNFIPCVTLFIPAYNEEKVIKKKIENTLRLDYPKDMLEVFVLVDESNDTTEAIVNSYKKQGIRIWVQRPRRGKMSALNAKVPEAKGEIILFSDANSMYAKDAVRKIVRHFTDQKVGLVCGELRLIDSKSLVSKGEGFYWRYERFLKKKESVLGQLLVVNGSIYAIRKRLFSFVNPELADDFVLPMRIARAGYRLIYEPRAVNREKISNIADDQFQRKVRIISQGIKASFSVLDDIFTSSALRVFEFLFHKFLRWFVFVFSVLLLVSNAMLYSQQFYNVIFNIQIIFYFFALAGYCMQKKRKLFKVFFIPFYFCLVNLASFCGFMSFISGRSKATWEKAESTR